jgi:hypothetical protein
MFTLLRILTLGVVDLRRNKPSRTTEERSVLLGSRRDRRKHRRDDSPERLFDSTKSSTTSEGVLLRVFTAILVAAIATVWIVLAVSVGDSAVASGSVVDGDGASETARMGRTESERRVFEAFGSDDGREVRAGAAWGAGWMQYH